jgi:citrate lyase beta subunit
MPSSGIRLRRSQLAVRDSSRRMLEKVPSLGADVVLLDLEVAVEQDDRKRAREPIIAAMRELGWSACSGRRASAASSGIGSAAPSSR